MENHPWLCLPSPCHHSCPAFSSHYWIWRLLSDSVTQLCSQHSQAGNPAGNEDQGAAFTRSSSSLLLRGFSASCLQQNQCSSSISSNFFPISISSNNFCSHWLLQMVVLSQHKLNRCLNNIHSLFFFLFYFCLLHFAFCSDHGSFRLGVFRTIHGSTRSTSRQPLFVHISRSSRKKSSIFQKFLPLPLPCVCL